MSVRGICDAFRKELRPCFQSAGDTLSTSRRALIVESALLYAVIRFLRDKSFSEG